MPRKAHTNDQRSQVEAALEKMPAEYLDCRRKHDDRKLSAKLVGRAYMRYYRCSRCDSEVTEIIDPDGFITSSTRKYPNQDYLFTGMGQLGRSARAAVRLHSVLNDIGKL